ncbi:MAG: phage tail tape measure protein, partial [Nitrospira sp.]|nr:phage tail tape measure protein [Nitrospira sp.]
MGETVRRDILIKIRTDSDLTQIDRTISRLDDLERRVERLNPRLRLRVTADTAGADANLRGVAGRADLAARAMVGRLDPSARRAGAALNEVGAAAGHAGDTLQSAAGKVLLWSLASGAIYGTVRAVRGGIDAFSEIEAATVRLERVGRGFGDTQDEIAAGARFVTGEILRQSVALGQSSAEAQEAAVVFARLGLSQRETADATRVAMLAANVAGIGAADAAKFLASAISQFQLSASDLPDVLDKLNTLENTTRVRTEDLLQAISRGGAVFREAGGSLEEFAGITAVVAQTTGRSGAEIGNAFKTIASRLASVDVQGKVFEKTGIAIRGMEGDLLPIGELLGRLVVQFQNLSQAEQAELTTQIAGVRQRNILQAALDNYFKTQEQVVRQLTTAGSAEEENAKILELLDTKLKQLVASFEHLAATIGNSGLGRLLKEIVDAIRFVVDSLARLGVAGVLIVGAVTAYAAAVVLAATGTGLFSASLNALVAGFVRVNASLAGMVTGFGAHATAAGVSTTANLALAGSNEAVAASAARAAAAQSAMAGASATAAAA